MKFKWLRIMLLGMMIMLLGGFMSLIDRRGVPYFILWTSMIGVGMLIGVIGFWIKD